MIEQDILCFECVHEKREMALSWLWPFDRQNFQCGIIKEHMMACSIHQAINPKPARTRQRYLHHYFSRQDDTQIAFYRFRSCSTLQHQELQTVQVQRLHSYRYTKLYPILSQHEVLPYTVTDRFQLDSTYQTSSSQWKGENALLKAFRLRSLMIRLLHVTFLPEFTISLGLFYPNC